MDAVLLLSIITIFSGIIGVFIRYTFRSKCSDVVCCFGCCKIKRDIQRELEIEQTQINHNIPTGESPVSPAIPGPRPNYLPAPKFPSFSGPSQSPRANSV